MKLKKLYKHDNKKQIWRILPTTNNKVVVEERDTKTKEVVVFEGLDEYLVKLLDEIQENLYQKALNFRTNNLHTVDTYEEFKTRLSEEGGFYLAHWDGTAETEAKIKEETQATIRCIPFEHSEEGVCMVTGKPSKQRVVISKAY